jgi:hypothetical protein
VAGHEGVAFEGFLVASDSHSPHAPQGVAYGIETFLGQLVPSQISSDTSLAAALEVLIARSQLFGSPANHDLGQLVAGEIQGEYLFHEPLGGNQQLEFPSGVSQGADDDFPHPSRNILRLERAGAVGGELSGVALDLYRGAADRVS